MKSFDQILLTNRSWAQAKKQNDPDYFKKLSLGQAPKYLWIGCSDSRVPATEITGAEPGEIFVHRNIANLTKADDPSFTSVLKYAVDYLKVKHIVVCGHHACGGVKAAMDGLEDELLSPWISGIRETYLENKNDIDKHREDKHRVNNLAELNVLKQVDHLYDHPIVRQAWSRGQRLFIHGWIFDMETGELDSLKEVSPDELPASMTE